MMRKEAGSPNTRSACLYPGGHTELRDFIGNWQHLTCVYRGHLANTMDLRVPGLEEV